MESIADNDQSLLRIGDRLIEIEGINVENLSRDDIVAKIRSAGSQVTLLVQSMKNTDHLKSTTNNK